MPVYGCLSMSDGLDNFLSPDDLHFDRYYGHQVIYKVSRKKNVKSSGKGNDYNKGNDCL